ncbi:FadR/GntR family transcriptional regulator [Lacrimispora sp.]|jgi:DNA-binding FadR family transcriptional regulator|uniref:FadR/GntR family transcriptional regulator n=1 Tax=Lacrimispora sp. TaxID=2719234 RepID=UPI0028AF4324|nr:GntR family transcriptional regulator [Lacrimispora sp.]
MEFTKITAPSLKDLFVQQIEEKILSGQLPVGCKMPPEREMAEQMKVSRAVVNGGINELKRKGFLEVLPRQGTYVADFSRNGNLQTLIALLEYRGNKLDKAGIRAILEIRTALEQLAVGLVIDSASAEDINQLELTAKKLKSTDSIQKAAQIAFQYHHDLAYYAGNTVLTLIYSSFKEVCIVLWVRFCKLYGIQALYGHIIHLQRLLNNRDKEGANQWIQHYLTETIEGSQQIYEES